MLHHSGLFKLKAEERPALGSSVYTKCSTNFVVNWLIARGYDVKRHYKWGYILNICHSYDQCYYQSTNPQLISTASKARISTYTFTPKPYAQSDSSAQVKPESHTTDQIPGVIAASEYHNLVKSQVTNQRFGIKFISEYKYMLRKRIQKMHCSFFFLIWIRLKLCITLRSCGMQVCVCVVFFPHSQSVRYKVNSSEREKSDMNLAGQRKTCMLYRIYSGG